MLELFDTVFSSRLIMRLIIVVFAVLGGLFMKEKRDSEAARRHESNQAEREEIKKKYGE